MNTFTSFDGIRIAYLTRVRARPLFSCMEGMSMGWASSEISNVFFRCWKSGTRCSGRCLGERFRFPILPSKEGQACSAHYWQQEHAPSCRTCAVPELPTNREREQRTKTQRW
jgi:hypothetical protein